MIGDTNEPDGSGYGPLVAALRVSPLDALPITHSMVRGLISGRLDRAFLYEQGEAAGVELEGKVCHGLPDVSDHYAVRYEIVSTRATKST